MSTLAFSLSSIDFYLFLLKNRKKYLIFSIIFFYLISNYKIIFFSFPKGFTRPGIHDAFNSVFLFTIFSTLSIEKLNAKIISIIKQVTKYTLGIYCLHFEFQYYFKLKLDKEGTFIGCVILYIFTYFISLIGFKVLSKSKMRYLFS